MRDILVSKQNQFGLKINKALRNGRAWPPPPLWWTITFGLTPPPPFERYVDFNGRPLSRKKEPFSKVTSFWIVYGSQVVYQWWIVTWNIIIKKKDVRLLGTEHYD